MKLRKDILGKVSRVVIKLGTGLLTDAHNRLSLPQIEDIVTQLAALRATKKQIIVVTSGAIGAGMAELGIKQRPKRLDELQAAAAIGQSKLMAIYDRLFGNSGITVAQVLLTHDDLQNRTRHLNAHNTLATLLARGVVPIINENDTVAVDEIKFGDNDRLGALTATLIDADLLIILSHVEGLLDEQKRVVPTVSKISEIESLAGGTDRLTSVGGMKSKIEAAKIATRAGIPLVIADGNRASIVRDVLAGEEVGTIFLPCKNKLASRKRWIAFFQHPAGKLVVDEGAKLALSENAKSLLAKGILSVDGKFAAGDVVSICDKNQVEFARGLTKVNGITIKSATGVVIHRDDLVILQMDLKQQMRLLAERSRDASRALAKLDAETKNSLLRAMADRIEKSAEQIKSANAKDLEAGKKSGLSAAMLDRLTLSDKRIAEMAKGVREVADLPDPVGKSIRDWTRPNGIKIQKVRVPIGVILIIYESRPNVTADAGCLCFKTGNAVILRGGSEAIHSNLAIAEAMNVPGLPPNSITVVPTTDRAAVDELLQLDDLINLCIPRGGEGLIRAVTEKSRIPVIKHYKGVCHVFVDRDADFDMAEKIVVNAKCQRPGVCNAIETLLIDEKIADQFLPRVAKTLAANKVELRGDERTCQLVPTAKSVTEDDWYAEYLELILAVRVVNGSDEAIDHITKYGSAHSDAIVTRNKATAEKFLREVDSSSVFWNASTRLADGNQYGFGAEIGISTDKLHARGPMGLEELTSYKFVVIGDGQLRE